MKPRFRDFSVSKNLRLCLSASTPEIRQLRFIKQVQEIFLHLLIASSCRLGPTSCEVC